MLMEIQTQVTYRSDGVVFVGGVIRDVKITGVGKMVLIEMDFGDGLVKVLMDWDEIEKIKAGLLVNRF